jgi:hypothetical protein
MYSGHEFIIREGDQVLETIYVMNGRYKLGYRFNNKIKFSISCGTACDFDSQKTHNMIGGYNCLFATRSAYFYRLKSDTTEVLTIRRRNFHALNKEHPKYVRILKKNTLRSYNAHIRFPILKSQ